MNIMTAVQIRCIVAAIILGWLKKVKAVGKIEPSADHVTAFAKPSNFGLQDR